MGTNTGKVYITGKMDPVTKVTGSKGRQKEEECTNKKMEEPTMENGNKI